MKNKFKEEDIVLINSKAIDLKSLNGIKAKITEVLPSSVNNDYEICYLDNGKESKLRVRENEIQDIKDKRLLQLEVGQEVIYEPLDIKVEISQIDLIHSFVAIKFSDGGVQVVESEKIKLIEKDSDSMVEKLGYFSEKGLELGKLVDLKQESYGDSVSKTSKLVKIFLEDYKKDDGTYVLTEELIDHILLQVRIIDKQNRIFSNPKADKMGESPYKDISGYGLLGERMQGTIHN
ncbi:hypothetical protein [Heyndrickxia camelliae]|uniref:Uncharacterized protein n=1 Tax=Heyndrickxia camelliae TaxID=1707093 RepID=A0A2N3LFZ9_9BACI|nr:hypothetical protein [Heyndrickxia camelliae]PKR83529.1 hypothetical protein CWO92_18360 [Heyndrickxia camelliae]